MLLSQCETLFLLLCHQEYDNNGTRRGDVVCLVAKSWETRHPPNIVPLFLSSISMQVQALNLALVKRSLNVISMAAGVSFSRHAVIIMVLDF